MKILSVVALLVLSLHVHAQQYFTRNGRISFFSKATIENIKADNNQVISVINAKTGEVRFSVLNNAFHFPKAKMEDHFNEDYMESSKYPKSTFKGNITDLSKISFDKEGTYTAQVTGDLSMHGITKKVTAPVSFTIKDGKLTASSVFPITLSDYNINIPDVVRDNISNHIEITATCNYELKK